MDLRRLHAKLTPGERTWLLTEALVLRLPGWAIRVTALGVCYGIGWLHGLAAAPGLLEHVRG